MFPEEILEVLPVIDPQNLVSCTYYPEAKIITQPPTEFDLEVPPKLEISTDESSKRPLKLGSLPISHTVCLFEDNLLLDPTDEEEEISGASVTIG